ncbi:MAG: large subunit ribosomal protein [Planctomycetota bacterium]|nr:MAG: large subunit ribosomal protein [Planctomycetota bacterium]
MADTTTLPEQRFTAKLRHARISPQKVRYVATVIRGQNVNRALEILQATNRRGARFLHKLLKSAIANAESITSDRNLDIDVEELRIETLMIDGGVSLKRWRTAPQGRAVPILKRTSHITLVLGPNPDEPKKERRATTGKKAAKAEKAGSGPAVAPAHEHSHGKEGQAHEHGHEHPEGHHQHHDHQHRHEPDHKHGGQHEKGHKPPPDKKKG